MNDYNVSDYGIFGDAVESTNLVNQKIGEVGETVTESKTKINDQSVFMGPIQENCMEVFNTLDTDFTSLKENYSSMADYLVEASAAYQKGDKDASSVVLSVDGKQVSMTSTHAGQTPVSTTTIPDNISQAGYTVTCYGEGGWYLGGGSEATSIASGTRQESVHNEWLSDGARYKNGIAVMNIDGVDHYLVATASALGKVGDCINVNLKNGQTIPCVVADAKSSGDSNYTTYGHANSSGSVNILEFEVDRNTYNANGNPQTSTWGLEWDSSSNVSSVDNYGSIL